MASGRSIKELPPDDQPRERLRLRGASSLTNSELIAILLGTGTRGESVLALAQRMITENGDLVGLMRMSLDDLESIKGLGPAKATKVKASLEIASRVLAMGNGQRPSIASPDDVVNLVGIEMAALDHEQLRVVLLDTKHVVLAIHTLYVGSANQAQVRIAELFKEAIRRNAVAIIIVHNHPSGDPTPSSADVSLTTEIARAGELLNIDVLDHLIIGQGRHTSLRRLGLGFSVRSNGE